jgi:thioredoxin
MKKTEKRKIRLRFGANLMIITVLTWTLCACQNSDSSPSHSSIKNISGAEQLQTIIQSSDSGLIMIDFYADWCGPCRTLSPRLEKIAQENGNKVTIYKLDIEKHKKIAAQYGVRSIPFVAFFKNKKIVHQLKGLYPANAYLKAINQFS